MMTFDADASSLQQAMDGNRPVLVQFWAEWCAPCRAMIPVVDQFAKTHDEAFEVARVDIDRNPDLAMTFQVTAVPSFMVAAEGAVVDRFVGAMPPAAFAARVEKALSASAH